MKSILSAFVLAIVAIATNISNANAQTLTYYGTDQFGKTDTKNVITIPKDYFFSEKPDDTIWQLGSERNSIPREKWIEFLEKNPILEQPGRRVVQHVVYDNRWRVFYTIPLHDGEKINGLRELGFHLKNVTPIHPPTWVWGTWFGIFLFFGLVIYFSRARI